MAGPVKAIPKRAPEGVACLLMHGSAEKACRAMNPRVSLSCFKNWMANAEFQSLYRSEQAKLLDQARDQLQAIAGRAVDALSRNLQCGVPVNEITAAKAVLDMCGFAATKQATVNVTENKFVIEFVNADKARYDTNGHANGKVIDADPQD